MIADRVLSPGAKFSRIIGLGAATAQNTLWTITDDRFSYSRRKKSIAAESSAGRTVRRSHKRDAGSHGRRHSGPLRTHRQRLDTADGILASATSLRGITQRDRLTAVYACSQTCRAPIPAPRPTHPAIHVAKSKSSAQDFVQVGAKPAGAISGLVDSCRNSTTDRIHCRQDVNVLISRDGTRTRTLQSEPGILSPVRLPIPPLGLSSKNTG